MIRPTLEQARELSKENTIVPISLELYSDIKTPIEVLRAIKEKGKQCFLLESVEGGEKWGRYSFLGYQPKLSLSCNDGELSLNQDGKSKMLEGNPNDALKKILAQYKSPSIDFLPPFTGGFVGYISYDYMKYCNSSLKLDNINSEGFNDLYLMLFDNIIAFDHLKQKIYIIVNVQKDNLENNYINGVLKLKEIEALVKGEGNNSTRTKFPSQALSDFCPLFSKEEYCKMVEKVKEHIFEGDIFQAVISNRMQANFEGDLLSTYRALRTVNPSPYMFYMDFKELQIAGASPETLVTLKNGELLTFPIAGTCPRGETQAEDDMLIENLMRNEKELSEHNMLVDLGRNDLGKISEFGTVKVSDYQKPIKFSHVTHITSTVTSRIKPEFNQVDAISAILPAGTLSGAPKIRACEIINKLEGHKRGVYGGAVGYIDFTGNMDMCIAIRMAVLKENKIYVQAGAGIVADSVPENEYNESINKAKAMIKAIELSQEVEV